MPTYYSCGTPESEWPEGEDIHLDYQCPDCADYLTARPGFTSRDEYEDYDSSPDRNLARDAAGAVELTLDADLPDMLVPQTRRQVSCEWEGSDGVSTAYEACKLVNGADAEYHGDGTCDGEVVFGRLSLWEDASARYYARSVSVIERLRAMGALRVGFNAGHHIHVAARDSSTYEGLSPNNLVSLYSVFAHCEDLLYRLAAAGWSGHRSENGGGYSAPMFKLASHETRTAKNVGNRIGGDRYQGLNVTPYLDSIQRCRCGAYRFGEWQSCECDDNRMTVEWRLWNASVSPRKIRAYIAISAVLTDYAANVDVRDVNKLDENPWSGTSHVDEESLLAQLDYLTTRPGFTSRDRKDLYWLASISPGMGELAREYENTRVGVSTYDSSPVAA